MKNTYFLGALSALLLLGAGCNAGPVAKNTETSTDATQQAKCLSKYEAGAVIGKKQTTLTFQYPCGWNVRNPGGGTVVVTSPDGKASFQWPTSDGGLHDLTLVKESKVQVNGKEYPRQKYSSDLTAQTVEFVSVPIRTSEEGPGGFEIGYEGDSYAGALDGILSSIKF